MVTKFIMGRDINGYVCFSLPFTDTKKSVALATGVEQHFTVPSDVGRVAIVTQPGTTVWVAHNSTAALPTGSIADTTSELNPGVREIKVNAGDTLSLITSDTSAEVGIQMYAI